MEALKYKIDFYNKRGKARSSRYKRKEKIWGYTGALDI